MTIPRRSTAAPQRLTSLSRSRATQQASQKSPREEAPGSLQVSWAAGISKREWVIYSSAIDALRETGVPFLLGGGFALAAYTGRWRDTKDIDFYVRRKHRHRAIAALKAAGFTDYYSRVPYDRKWIYRNVRSNMIVDVIWAMANQRAQVDEAWFRRARPANIRGEQLAVLPLEEMLWCKLYIMQRDHCDWTDIFNLLYARGKETDWDHLLRRLQQDEPLLRAALTVFGWLCPNQARQFTIWRRLNLRPPPAGSAQLTLRRTRLLDSRAWFAARLPGSKKLEI